MAFLFFFACAMMSGCARGVGCPGGACNATYYYISRTDRKALKGALASTGLNKRKYSSLQAIKNPRNATLVSTNTAKKKRHGKEGLFEEGVERMYKLRSR